MKKERIDIKKELIVDRYCDVCGNPAKGRHCVICQRDICENHTIRKWDEWGGDYSHKYCIDCWKIGEPFRRRKSVLDEIHDQELEDLEDAWRKKALEYIQFKNMK